jgi:putative transposase
MELWPALAGEDEAGCSRDDNSISRSSCYVRWYLAYNMNLRDFEEMMAERDISVDHATIHRWTVHYTPLLLERFNLRKRAVSRSRHVDELYIKVRGQWMYLYRAIASNGDKVEFWFSERHNLAAARRFLSRALKRHGRP